MQPTAGAVDLLDDLSDRSVLFVVATSAAGEERERLLAVLDDPEVSVTDNDDTDDSKPTAGSLRAAMASLDAPPGPDVIMIGDSPWDRYAAAQAGIRFVAVRCGGFADDTLKQSGASLLATAPARLIGLL